MKGRCPGVHKAQGTCPVLGRLEAEDWWGQTPFCHCGEPKPRAKRRKSVAISHNSSTSLWDCFGTLSLKMTGEEPPSSQ